MWIQQQAQARLELVDETDKVISAERLVELLRRVAAGQSLHKAARNCGYSYRHAWGLIQEAERRGATPLLERRVGGVAGGGSELTAAGRRVLQDLESLHKRAVALVSSEINSTSSAQPVLFLAGSLETIETGLVAALSEACLQDLGIRVGHIAAGSGTALDIAKGGRIDLVLTHAPQLEQEFMEDGWASAGLPLMRSRYVIVGPEHDPAGLRGLSGKPDPLRVFESIATSHAPFVSRGDNSGTHIREQALWRAAGIYPREELYHRVGAGNAAMLAYAAAAGGYALVDESGIRRFGLTRGLEVVYCDEQATEHLGNTYSLTAVDPSRKRDPSTEQEAERFLDWIRQRGAEIIGSTVAPSDGQPLFEAVVQ